MFKGAQRVTKPICREHYSPVHPHSSLGYRPPAPESIADGPPSAALRADQRQKSVQVLSEKLV